MEEVKSASAAAAAAVATAIAAATSGAAAADAAAAAAGEKIKEISDRNEKAPPAVSGLYYKLKGTNHLPHNWLAPRIS